MDASEPHTIVVRVYFPMREGGTIADIPINNETRELLSSLRREDERTLRADVLSAETLWHNRLPPSDNYRLGA